MLRTTVIPLCKVIVTDEQLIDKEISSDLIIYELPIFIKNIIIEYNDIKVIHLCEELQDTTTWGTDFKNYREANNRNGFEFKLCKKFKYYWRRI